MFTEKKPNGEWRAKGIDFKDCTSEMYGALCKLRDYEATGLEPDDFMGDEYKKKRLYKVHYTDSTGLHVIYCESRKNAEFTADLLREKGLDAGVNQWSWHALIEDNQNRRSLNETRNKDKSRTFKRLALA